MFDPPYLFKNGNDAAARPVIEKAPRTISYRGSFDVKVSGNSQVASIVLLRSDHNTHSLTTGDRYVKLAFRPGNQGELRVAAPKRPAQAVPGIYMLFAVDANGVPSLGRRVDIKLEE